MLGVNAGTEVIIFGHGGGYHRETQDKVDYKQTPGFVGDSLTMIAVDDGKRIEGDKKEVVIIVIVTKKEETRRQSRRTPNRSFTPS